MRISHELLDEVIRHARSSQPYEACGIIAAKDGIATRVCRAINVAKDPANNYQISARDHYDIDMEMRDRGEYMGAVYHSHPDTDAAPSQADLDLAFYPGVLYVIVGMLPEPEVRAYWIVEGVAEEAELDLLAA